MSDSQNAARIPTHEEYSTSSSTSTLTTLSSTNWNGNILLFFVALGFGILFCNLWVMIGIKYCYKYSNVNRPETIEIQRIMPQSQSCQKKLMTQGEADKKFPSILYKVWQSQHKHQKQQYDKVISTEGSNQPISTHNNQSCSLSNQDNIQNEPDKQNTYEQEKLHDSDTLCDDNTKNEMNNTSSSCTDLPSNIPNVSYYNPPLTEHNDVGIYIPDEKQSKYEDEYMKKNKQEKVSSTYFPEDTSFGDTCAICLDMFQDEDEIRVLTCGHVYHSSCIVPWFTTRRAMCPLCKCDFYIPKTSMDINTENTSRNIAPFPEAQIYEHLHHSPMIFFSTYEPQHVDQYRVSVNNNYRSSLYNMQSNIRSLISRRMSRIPLFRRMSRIPLFRRNHSLI